jgi:hypothetical protein
MITPDWRLFKQTIGQWPKVCSRLRWNAVALVDRPDNVSCMQTSCPNCDHELCSEVRGVETYRFVEVEGEDVANVKENWGC